MLADWSEFLAACSALLQRWPLTEWLAYSRPAGLFLLGLTGGAVHCAGMCGPFVLSQVGSRLSALPLAQATGFTRLRGMALLPYHAGRATTYTLLGGIAAGLAGGVESVLLQGYLPAVALLLAALLFAGLALRQVAPVLLPAGFSTAGQWWHGRFAPLFRKPDGLNGYILGIVLGFLPCGLVYAALLLAGASGSWRDGALAMAAFALGTMPALLVVGFLGAAAGRRWRGILRWGLVPVLLFNALLLLVMALRWLPA